MGIDQLIDSILLTADAAIDLRAVADDDAVVIGQTVVQAFENIGIVAVVDGGKQEYHFRFDRAQAFTQIDASAIGLRDLGGDRQGLHDRNTPGEITTTT